MSDPTSRASDEPGREPVVPGGSRAELLLVTTLYVALGLWWLWPLPLVAASHAPDLTQSVPTAQADTDLVIWSLAWDTHALLTRPWAFFHANIFFPSSHALAYSEHFLGLVPLFAPVYAATGNPVLAANFVRIAVQPLCALAAFALARRFVAPAPAAVAGLLYAFHFYRLRLLPHFHLLATPWVPLALLATERWLERARWRDAALLAVCLFLQAATSFYLAYALALAYAIWLPLSLWAWRARLDARRLAGLAAAGALAAAPLVALALPYLELRRLGLIPSYGGAEAPDAYNLRPEVAAWAVDRFLRSDGVGPVGYALGAIALLPPYREGTPGRARVTIAALALAALGIVAAYGPVIQVGDWTVPGPYRWFLDWLPGLASVRVPMRLAVVAALGLSLLAALGLARLTAPLGRAGAWTASLAASGLVVGLLAARISRWDFPQQPVGERLPPVYQWLAQHGDGRALLEKPPGNLAVKARRMVFSTEHWLPLVDAYSGYPPKTGLYIQQLSQDLPQEAALARLADSVDVGWIVVHLDQLQQEERARWSAPLPPGLERVAQLGDDLVLRVTRAGDPVRRARLLSETETPGGVPLEPLGETCPGELAILGQPPASWPAHEVEHLLVAVRNRDGRPWPAFGFVPRYLVHLVACFAPPGGDDCDSTPIGLTADVPKGGQVVASIFIETPREPGDRVLVLRLRQDGVGALDRCGVAPLRVPLQIGPPRPPRIPPAPAGS